jgi:hypothetical protein
LALHLLRSLLEHFEADEYSSEVVAPALLSVLDAAAAAARCDHHANVQDACSPFPLSSPAPCNSVRACTPPSYTPPDPLDVGAHLGLIDEDALLAFRRQCSPSNANGVATSLYTSSPTSASQLAMVSALWVEAWGADDKFAESAIAAVETPLNALLKGARH